MIKGFEITDKNIKYVKLSRGEWLIQDKPVKIDNYSDVDYQVDSFDNIRRVTTKSVLESVQVGDITYTGNEFLELESSLEQYRDEDGDWDDIDKEYEWKKLQKLAERNYVNKTILGEPELVDIKTGVIDTGSSYISPKFENGDINGLFYYNQDACWRSTVSKKFLELGFTFYINDLESTKDGKKWSNSTHSCIQYVKAFGKYILSDAWRNPQTKVGTLEQCKDWEKIDVDKLNEIIQLNYNLEYGIIDINSKVKEIYNKVVTITENVRKLDVVKKSYNDQRFLNNYCNELTDLLKRIILQNEN
jgi:hypothetical protein